MPAEDWNLSPEAVEEGRLYRLQVLSGGRGLSFLQLIRLWRDDPAFRHRFSRCLADIPLAAFYWETPPITRATVTRPFECVLIDAPPLHHVTAQPQAFAEHFSGGDAAGLVASFANLGGDALLVAPRPYTATADYAHLAGFLRTADDNQLQAFWREVAGAVQRRLADRPLWLSTCGTGVYWLHVRLDSSPKYYSYRPYISWSG